MLDYLGVMSRHLTGPCHLDTGTEEECEEEQVEVLVKRVRQSALIDVYEQVKFSCERWRMGGLYVDSEALLATSRISSLKSFLSFLSFMSFLFIMS